MQLLHKPNAIVWDWDGTVVSTDEVIRHALLQTLNEYHVPPDKQHIALEKAGIVSLRDFFPEIFGNAWEKARTRFYHYFEHSHLEKLELIAEADQTIRYIHNQHPEIYQAVVSNKRGDLLRKEVEHLGLSSCFSSVIGATDAKEISQTQHH